MCTLESIPHFLPSLTPFFPSTYTSYIPSVGLNNLTTWSMDNQCTNGYTTYPTSTISPYCKEAVVFLIPLPRVCDRGKTWTRETLIQTSVFIVLLFTASTWFCIETHRCNTKHLLGSCSLLSIMARFQRTMELVWLTQRDPEQVFLWTTAPVLLWQISFEIVVQKQFVQEEQCGLMAKKRKKNFHEEYTCFGAWKSNSLVSSLYGFGSPGQHTQTHCGSFWGKLLEMEIILRISSTIYLNKNRLLVFPGYMFFSTTMQICAGWVERKSSL